MRFIKRMCESLAVVWVVATLAFFALRLGRVDPIASLAAQGLADETQAAELRRELGLDRPLLVQYRDFMIGVARGDLGRSIFSGQDVAAMIAEASGFTVPLAAAAWLASIAIGLGLGAAASRTGGSGRLISALLTVGASTPVAWSGLLLLWGAVPLLAAPIPEPVRALIRFALPATALAVAVGCSIGRAAESSIRGARGEPFSLAMRAHGFPSGLHAEASLLRAAIAPVLALAGMEAAFLLAGTMITEVVFARPGLGRLLVDALLRGDYPVVQALIALAALGYAAFGMIADFSSAALDPRVRGTP